MKQIFLSFFFALIPFVSFADDFSISGTILDKATGEPVEFAVIQLTRTEQWAVADAEGRFTIRKVQGGGNVITVSCLGYISDTKEINITKDIPEYKIYLKEDNLTLESVVVTAKENDNTATTSRTIDKNALDHIQMMNVADISSLLPGGMTVNPSLTDDQRFNLRAGGVLEKGNASFGTAVEVDGVRISNNATFASASNGVKGALTNNIASTNVESIEVITGVPSVEYGDMTSGVVKVNTQKGVTPYVVTMSTNPRTKQISASKGFGLGSTRRGKSNGFLNANLEYTNSVTDRRSPYTSYDRKQISLTYSNLFSSGIFASMPLRFSVGATGNLGGRNSIADPDRFRDTFTKTNDNTIRGNISLNWLLSRKWITNVELNASVSYSDRMEEVKGNYSNAAWMPALHGLEEGYFVGYEYSVNPDAEIIMLQSGAYYNTMFADDRPLNYKIALKANWARQIGKINNRLKIGADWTGDGNFGVGQYTGDMATASTFREYRYCDVPFMNGLSAYIEDNVTIPIGKTRLNIIAGIRNDNIFINGSAYGNASGFSPRVNLKYTIFSPKERHRNLVKELSFRASWGMASKLPSFSIMYPVPTYKDIDTFASTSAEGASFMAYYIMPRTLDVNENLKWQRNNMAEAGFDIDIDGYKISLVGFYNRTFNAYRLSRNWTEFAYNYTDAKRLQEECTIPAANRKFEVDRNTGIVTVYDKTGVQDPETIGYTRKESFVYNSFANNSASPMTRYGLEWVIDFKRIRPINTTIRLDGSFYGYRYVDTTMEHIHYDNVLMSDGSPYRYVGIYYGDDNLSNGRETRSINTNLTVITHIPKVRMIISMKFEACLFSYSRYLSEKADGSARSYPISDRSDVLSIIEGTSIYDGNNLAVTFPDYYYSYGDPTPRNYLEDLKQAKAENNKTLYQDLAKMAVLSNYVYQYGKDYLTPYFSANLSITKEIGDIASISFYANNFFNNIGQVYSSRTGRYTSASGYVADFYYGLSLRLKF